jgi:hypothetical protein
VSSKGRGAPRTATRRCDCCDMPDEDMQLCQTKANGPAHLCAKCRQKYKNYLREEG